MSLADLWFVVVAVFWTGFFVLEGFDFGVGALHSVLETEGDTPSAVFIRPCTIHGCLPFSVSSQPALSIRNGVTTAQVARNRNMREVASLRRYASQAPHSDSTATRDPR